MGNFERHMQISVLISVVFLIIYFNNAEFFEKSSFTFLHALGAIPLTIIFGSLPDVDHKFSKPHKWIVNFIILFLIVLAVIDIKYSPYAYYSLAALFLLFYLVNFIKHKQFFHTWGVGLLAAPLYFLHPVYFALGFFALVGHLITDKFRI